MFCSLSPNNVIEWLIFLLRMQEVQGSNLSPDILIEGFDGFPQFFQSNAGIVPYSRIRTLLSNPFQFVIHLPQEYLHSTLYSLTY
jgi:hypothetical protein